MKDKNERIGASTLVQPFRAFSSIEELEGLSPAGQIDSGTRYLLRCPQLCHNFLGYTAGRISLIWGEGDCADAGMAASSVALANFRQIDHVLFSGPWI